MNTDQEYYQNISDIIINEPKDNYKLYAKLASYYVAVLLIIGIIGNFITFILFTTRQQLKRVPSSQYLAALSLTDFCFVLCLSLIWLKSFGVHWQDLTIVCPVSIYLSNTSCLLSGWYIMALTAEMTLAIVDPYRARRYCSRGLVTKRIVAIACFGLLLNIWTLIIARSVATEDESESIHLENESYIGANRSCPDPIPPMVQYECGFYPEDAEYYNNLTILDSIVSFSLPLLVTLILNATIGFFLLRSFTKRQTLVEGTFTGNVVSTSTSALAVVVGNVIRQKKPCLLAAPSASRTNSHELCTITSPIKDRRRTALSPLLSSNSAEVTSKKRNQRSRMTLVSSLLITKSLIYLILNMPNYVHRLWTLTRAQDGEMPSENEKLVQLTVYLLFYTQYSLNFVIYSMHACKTACRPRNNSESSVRRYCRAQ